MLSWTSAGSDGCPPTGSGSTTASGSTSTAAEGIDTFGTFRVNAATRDRILREVRGYLEWHGLRSANLRRLATPIARRTKVDYYDLRYVIRRYGADAGLVFLGKSRVDTVGLDTADEIRPVRVEDVVLRVLEDADTPRSVAQIVAALQEGSRSNVEAKLELLAGRGSVVRLTSGWTTLERALSGVSDERAAAYVDELLGRTDKVVHIDAIREWLAPAFDVALPLPVWRAIVRKHAIGHGWTVRGSLVAKHAFAWSGLRDVVREHARPNLAAAVILARVREEVLLSRRVAGGAALRDMIGSESAARSRQT